MFDRTNYPQIPPPLYEGLDLYAKHGIETGSFLRAVLENDLAEAVIRADAQSLLCLPHLVTYIALEMPPTCHGSAERVQAWLTQFANPQPEAILPR